MYFFGWEISLSSIGDLFKAEAVNGQLIKLGSRLEDETIASLISAYGRQKKLKQAQEVFAAVADSPILGNPIINSMIDACVKCGKFEEAYLLYEEVAQRGHNLGAVGIGMVVNALTNSGMIVNSLVDQPLSIHFDSNSFMHASYACACDANLFDIGNFRIVSLVYTTFIDIIW